MHPWLLRANARRTRKPPSYQSPGAKLPRRISGVRLGRLAVDQQHHGRALAELLLVDAHPHAQRVYTEAGGIGLFVDAIDEQAASTTDVSVLILPGSSVVVVPASAGDGMSPRNRTEDAHLELDRQDAVVKHHKDVPSRLLEPVPELSCGTADSGNLIVQGDNLHALKSLVATLCRAGEVHLHRRPTTPATRAGSTRQRQQPGNPPLAGQKWSAKEGETLDRHDRWLCMMYIRAWCC